jgi:tRNA 5-methylaminomethyl-2-thiouridine biosynthesis bifunctional protein
LLFGDASATLKTLDESTKVDAWYLDGFGPSKNPQMWDESLFAAMARISRNGTTASTFTVARKIRDALQAEGFSIEKVKGFGQKREMLTATMAQHSDIKQQAKQKNGENKQPWFHSFAVDEVQKNTHTIIGAGIAGLSLAASLVNQGVKVRLIDRQAQACRETSGNPQAMVLPSFTLNDSVEARFYLSAFLYAKRSYEAENYHQVGVHELAFTQKQQQWQDEFLSRFDLPAQLVKKYKKGLLYGNSGWLDTQGHADFVTRQLKKGDYRYQQANISRIEFENNQWCLYENDTLVSETDVLILANGINALRFLPDYHIPISPKHGQVSYFYSKDCDEIIAQSPHIQLSKGYITPSWNGVQTMGATFDHIDDKRWFEKAETTDDHWQRNVELWDDTPYEERLKNTNSHFSRAGIRVTTPDHMPICGAVIDQEQFKKDYYDIKHGKYFKQYPIPKAIENLYLFTGLGARGFTSAPLLAESLCNQILGQPQVLSNEHFKAINPNRFLYKALKRK